MKTYITAEQAISVLPDGDAVQMVLERMETINNA